MKRNLLSATAARYLTGLALALAAWAAPGHLRAQTTLGGTVFEDVNYGGGAGRPYAVANAAATASGFVSGSIRRPGATVELYDNTGTLAGTAVTDGVGAYLFSGVAAGSYTVRVVSGSVTSSRPGSIGSLVPVQTFVNGDVNRVGGENPAVADSGPNGPLVVTAITTGNNINLAFTGQTIAVDNTMFLDNVEVLSGGTPLGVNPIVNPGFETGTLAGPFAPGYQYNPSAVVGVGWTFNAGAGIQANSSAFTPPNTGSGSRASFLQLTGAVNQAFNLPAGTYQVRFVAANRVSGGQQTVNVTVNGFSVLAGLQAVVGTYNTYLTLPFTVGPGGGGVPLSSVGAHSLAPVTVAASPVTGVDFGFSFDVVTNTNNAGQGSLRQFIVNANALTNASLAQAGQVAGRETSIFMIPNGAVSGAPAGLRNGLATGLNASNGANRWARISLVSALPNVSDTGTTLDGSTQTANIGDSNPGQVGLGGPGGQFPTVGVSALPFAKFERPEVEFFGTSFGTALLQLTGTNATLRGFALHGGSSSSGAVNVVNTTGFVVENNLVGINAFEVEDPAILQPNTTAQYGVNLSGGLLNGVVRRNLIGYANSSGLNVQAGGTSVGSDLLVVANELVQNGYRVAGGDNLTFGGAGSVGPVRVVGNLIRTANSDGVQFEIGSVAIGGSGTGRNVVRNNTFFDNGNGGSTLAQSQLEGAALLYLQRSGAATGTNADSLYLNIVNQTQAAGFVVGYGQRGVIITRNSTYFNGTPFNSPTGGNLGIDLIPNPVYYVGSPTLVGARDYGNGDGVTPNDGTLNNALANGGMDYPVLTLATATGTTSATVNVAGYVGSAPGQATFAGAVVDFYTADNVPANNNGAVATTNPTILPHGEGRTYLGSVTADGSGNFTTVLTVPNGTPPLSGDAITGFLTATAYLPTRGTSEFGPNRPIIVAADVQAVLTGGGATTAGTTGTFSVTFSNQLISGPVTAAGVVATVLLPPGLSGVSVSGGGSYNPATGLVTYAAYSTATPGSLAAGASFSSVITYTQPAATSVSAIASIGTSTNEAGQIANNTSSATNATLLRYDVTTAISGPATVTAGNQVAYNVTTTNLGGPGNPSPAPLVVQTVSVPAGATNVYVTGGGVITGSVGAGYTVTFPTIPALAPAQSLTNTITFTAPSGAYTVGAAVSSSPADAVSGNNTASAATTASAASSGPANVFALISASSISALPGTPITFTITEGNRGPNAATGVSTTAVVPPGLPISGAGAVALNGAGPTGTSGTVATYAGGATYDAATGIVTFPTVASQSAGAGSNATYTIGFNAPASGVATATVAVQTTSPDAVPADNQATAQVTVTPPAAADLNIVLTGPLTADVGQPLAYILTTSNNGPASATAVGQVLSLPAGLPLTGASVLTINGAAPTGVSGSTATYAGGITYNATTGQLTIPPVASLALDGVLTTSINFVAPANGGLPLTVSAAISSTSPNPTVANNSASITTAIQATADVQVTLTGVGQIAPGNRITYGVTSLNNGPSAAPGVATTLNLPTGLPITGVDAVRINGQLPSSVSGGIATYPDGSTYDSRTAGGGSPNPGLVTLPPLANVQVGGGANNTVSFVLPLGYTGALVTTATVATVGIVDPIPSDNVAVVQPIIQAAVGSNNLGVTISGPATVVAGAPITLSMVTTSASAGSGILQFVQLPAGLTATGGTVTVTIGASPVLATYDPLSGLLTLPPVLNMTAGSSLTYAIVISQAPGTGPLLATASVSGNELDPANTNNIAQTPVAITPSTSLATTISGPLTAPVGGSVSYLIATSNGGPTIASGAAQTVTVPAGATSVLLNGLPVVPGVGGLVTLPIPTTLVPGAANTVTNTLSFVAPGAAGSSFAVPTSLTATGPGSPAPASSTTSTTLASPAPLARNVVNTLQAPEGNTANVPLPILPLSGQAQGVATLASYTILGLPLASQGVLYVWNGASNVLLNTTNFPGLVLTPTEAANLRFQPTSGFSGNATFLYLATDNAGTPSNAARYLVPVGPDASSAYATTPVKGGATAYALNDVLAYVSDPNTAVYTPSGQLYNATTGALVSGAANGLPTSGTNVVLASGSLPPGTTLNPTTGQVYVSNPAALVAGAYTFTTTTTDLLGGVNSPAVTITIGANPLPVELLAFGATAAGADAKLTWRTASERHNDHFDVERSANGHEFVKFAEVAGQGSKQSATDYALTDANAAKLGTTVYYRLRQVDTDGRTSYSPVRSVTFTTSPPHHLTTYPNPAHESTTLDLTALPAGSYTVTLTDLAGRHLRELTLDAGLLHLLPVQALAAGSYLLTVQGTAANAALRLTQHLTKE